MDVHAVFIILIMLPAAVKTEETAGEVEFWRDEVTLKCPNKRSPTEWYNKGVKLEEPNGEKYIFTYQDKGLYSCEYKEDEKVKSYQFYVEGKACKNCFEVDATVFLLVIIADLVATVVVMMMVYKCTKRKDSAGPTKTSKAPAPPRSQAPPAPSPDYEKLNPNTRSQDPYSVVNRMG